MLGQFPCVTDVFFASRNDSPCENEANRKSRDIYLGLDTVCSFLLISDVGELTDRLTAKENIGGIACISMMCYVEIDLFGKLIIIF